MLNSINIMFGNRGDAGNPMPPPPECLFLHLFYLGWLATDAQVPATNVDPQNQIHVPGMTAPINLSPKGQSFDLTQSRLEESRATAIETAHTRGPTI